MKHKKTKIDYSDIPEMTASFWKNATVHSPKKKKLITLRLDSDVLDWFQDQGKGYQTKINAILKTYVNAQREAG
jgi:uncharacterized protein (DUF4415 family)